MKLLLLALALACSTLNAEPLRKVFEADALPQNGFQTLSEMKAWASTSSFGGGRSGEITVSGRKVYYSDRMFTSGVPTSELTFYIQNKDGGIRPFLIFPMQRQEFRMTQEKEEIIVQTYNPPHKKWIDALRFSASMLPSE